MAATIRLVWDPKYELSFIQRMVDGLTHANVAWFREHKKAPPIDRAGVRYKLDTPSEEEWLHAPVLLQRLRGDCADLAAYEAGWLIAHGVPARAVVRPSRGNMARYHVIVKTEKGFGDPSARLGMRTE